MEKVQTKDLMDMLPEELESYLMEKLNSIKLSPQTHFDYLDLPIHNYIQKSNSDKIVTINGPKLINEILDSDHMFTAGEIQDILEDS